VIQIYFLILSLTKILNSNILLHDDDDDDDIKMIGKLVI